MFLCLFLLCIVALYFHHKVVDDSPDCDNVKYSFLTVVIVFLTVLLPFVMPGCCQGDGEGFGADQADRPQVYVDEGQHSGG